MYRKNNQFSDIDIYENFNIPSTTTSTYTSLTSQIVYKKYYYIYYYLAINIIKK